MIRYLKKGRDVEAVAAADAHVRTTVEDLIGNVAERGDAAVREYSQKFDNWAPESFRLSREQIDAAIATLSSRELEDIKFAQTQIRTFAQKQRDTMLDLEVETMPGVVLGHKHLPVNAVGCYIPRREVPDDRLGPHERADGEGGWRQAHRRDGSAVPWCAPPRHRGGHAPGWR